MDINNIDRKVQRIDAIGKELEIIITTMTMLRGLQGSINTETANRCMAIGYNLKIRVDALHDEYQKLKDEIENELQGYLNLGS